jgi:hypothetical protein
VQITGGNFIEIGGDFNLQSIQPLGNVDEMLINLEFGEDRARGSTTLPDGASASLSPCICLE